MNLEQLMSQTPIEEMSLGKIWQNFAAAVLPKNCSPVQTTEMKRAFYAGFVSSLEVGCHYSDIDEDKMVNLLSRFDKEAKHFFQHEIFFDKG